MRENSLIWFCHVYRSPEYVSSKGKRRCLNNHEKKKRKTKETRLKMLRNDLKICGLTKEIALNPAEWKDRIHVADPFKWT